MWGGAQWESWGRSRGVVSEEGAMVMEKKVMLWELVGWDPLQLSSRRPLTLSPGS